MFDTLDQYELEGDERIQNNTTYTTHNTYIGYGTEDKSEYDSLVAAGYDNIIYTDRTVLNPDVIPIKNTLKTSQVQGDFFPNPQTGKWTLITSLLSS